MIKEAIEKLEQVFKENALIDNVNDEEESPALGLFEADNGLWEFEAIKEIKEFLEKNIEANIFKELTIIG